MDRVQKAKKRVNRRPKSYELRLSWPALWMINWRALSPLHSFMQSFTEQMVTDLIIPALAHIHNAVHIDE